jgi:hypothetical protein
MHIKNLLYKSSEWFSFENVLSNIFADTKMMRACYVTWHFTFKYSELHQNKSSTISVLVQCSKLFSYKYNNKLMISVRFTLCNSKFKVFYSFTQSVAAPRILIFCRWHIDVHTWAWCYESSLVVPHTGSPSNLKQTQSITNGKLKVQIYIYTQGKL